MNARGVGVKGRTGKKPDAVWVDSGQRRNARVRSAVREDGGRTEGAGRGSRQKIYLESRPKSIAECLVLLQADFVS